MFVSEAERSFESEAGYRARDMAYSNVAPIPLHKEQGQFKGFPDRSSNRTEQRPPKSPKEAFSAFERRDKSGRGAGRPNSKPSGMNDPVLMLHL